jgi:16S rRNA (cytidine1402-2'-O)-methyltransferase
MLHIIPTPIGNLEDITFRAIRMLKEADIILAEDTRVTRKLLSHYDIETPLRAYHAHNEHKITQGLVDQLKSEDVNIAMVSDAGTPGISDPGFLLVRACVNEGIKVECLPGATAFVPALVASGIPCDKFHYEGFLPHKKGRQTRLIYLASLEHTFVLYESPNRLVKCLTQLSEFCGTDRKAAVCRELSKLHEEVRTDTLANLIAYFGEQTKVRGEIAIVVEGKK